MIKVLIAAVLISLHAVNTPFAGDKGGHAGHSGNSSIAHEEVVAGIKATFTVQTMKDAMKSMGMEVPKGMKETHHISIAFKDLKTGRPVSEGEARIKLQAPDRSEQTKDLQVMQGHFGADFQMAGKGRYGIMCRFKLADGKVRQTKFWYTVK